MRTDNDVIKFGELMYDRLQFLRTTQGVIDNLHGCGIIMDRAQRYYKSLDKDRGSVRKTLNCLAELAAVCQLIAEELDMIERSTVSYDILEDKDEKANQYEEMLRKLVEFMLSNSKSIPGIQKDRPRLRLEFDRQTLDSILGTT